MHKNSSIRAFTLVELLVVIAMIGILSAIVLASLANTRAKARISLAQDALHAYEIGLQYCAQEGWSITAPGASNDGGGGLMCAGGPAYVKLPVGWAYTAASTKSQIVASGDGKTITCTDTLCTTSS